jgi:hypothetical protein
MFRSSAVREAVTDKRREPQIRYDGHNTKRKEKKNRRKSNDNTGVLSSKVQKQIRQGKLSARGKMENAAKVGNVGAYVALGWSIGQ